MNEARIVDARVTPGHDGSAELVVFIQYENGARDHVTLAAQAAARLLERCQAPELKALQGKSWRQLLDVMD